MYTAIVITDFDEFHQMAEIVKIILQSAGVTNQKFNHLIKKLLDPKRISPRDYRTVSGYFLQIQDSRPDALWTPWGCLDLALHEHADWIDASIKIIRRCDAKTFIAKRPAPFRGSFGPVYSLYKCGQIKLPKAVLISASADKLFSNSYDQTEDYHSRQHNQTKRVWETLYQNYCFLYKL